MPWPRPWPQEEDEGLMEESKVTLVFPSKAFLDQLTAR